MIRCNHCGKLAPTGAASCQNCGMPLVGASGMGTAGQSQQQDLPAWLESLRAHDRPVANSMGDHQPFSMAELVDENAMPSWMSLDQSRLAESSEYPALPPKNKPASSPERQALSASGFEAGSLIDEKSLPSWMRGQESGQPIADQNLSANSLVQSESLPAWMKNLESGQPTPAQNFSTGSPQQSESLPPWMKNLEPDEPSQTPGWQAGAHYGLPTEAQIPSSPPLGAGNMPQTPISASPAYNYDALTQAPNQGFSAGDLVEQQSLPDWMKGFQEPGQQSPNWSVPTGSGFSAGELVDQQSLPTWMKSQQEQTNSGPIPARGVPVSGSGQGMGMDQGPSSGIGMPAANLLDENALPPWMREGEQGANAGNALGTQQPGSSGMIAGSLVDMNALPTWMRNQDNAQNLQPGGGVRGGQPQAQPRVPSRPRGEVGLQGQTEAAANAFASMLGVAASPLNQPGQPPTNLGVPQAQQQPPTNLGVSQAQPVPQAQQPAIPGWQSPQQPPVNQGPLAWQMPGAGASPPPGVPGAYYQQSAGMGVPQTPPRMMEQQPMYMGAGEPNRVGFGSEVSAVGNNSVGTQPASPKKKGFFDAIRDFFFKSGTP